MPVELVIGVVGLAVQVMETSSKIKAVIRAYKDAPREMQRLALKIDHAESMCQHIKKLFEQEDGRDSHAASLNEAVGIPILQSIHATLDEMSEMILKLQRKAEGKGTLKTAGWAWMDKKEKVQKLMGELESDLNILTQTMTSNIYSHVNIIRQQLVVQPTVVLQTPDEATQLANFSTINDAGALALRNMMNPSGELVVVKTEERLERHNWPFSLSALIKHRKISKKTRWNDKIETDTVAETKSITFAHPYLSQQLKFTYRFGSLCQPSYALTVPHLIDVRVPAWKSIGKQLDLALAQGDVQALQDLISTNQITPRTRVAGLFVGDHDDGGTLFEHALVYAQSDLCHFLARQDPSIIVHDEDEVAWPGTWVMFGSREFYKRSLESILYLLAPSYHRSDPVALFRFLAKPHPEPDYILNCYEFCRPQALNRISELVGEAVKVCHQAWISFQEPWNQRSDETDAWITLLTRLQGDGLELHARISLEFSVEVSNMSDYVHMRDIKNMYSFAGFVLWLQRRRGSESPDVWETTLFAWLKVIESLGIDVKEYLEVERVCCTRSKFPPNLGYNWPSDPSNCVESVDIVRSVYGLDVPTFEAQAVNEGPGSAVCLEFASLSLYSGWFPGQDFECILLNFEDEETPPHQNWKRAGPYDHKSRWPFTAGLMASLDLSNSPRPTDGEWAWREWRSSFAHTGKAEKMIRSSFAYAEELQQQRLQRRQLKRRCKMGLEEWPRKGKRAMPGTWVDGC